MRLSFLSAIACALLLGKQAVLAAPASDLATRAGSAISQAQYNAFSEASKLTTLAYCVPLILPPFKCASGYCQQFPTITVLDNFNTGLFAGMEGFIARDDDPKNPRIIISFRGSYNVMNAIVDIGDIIPAPYTPYGSNKCDGCTAGVSFNLVWQALSLQLISKVKDQMAKYPGHKLYVTGHSLGGAIAALAALEFYDRGWNPLVYTFGEPRTFNPAGAAYFDARFKDKGTFFRITHRNDPVPMVPFQSWNYAHHGDEYYIDSDAQPPPITAVRKCTGGSEDPSCNNSNKFNALNIVTAHLNYFRQLGICIWPISTRSLSPAELVEEDAAV